MQRLLVLCLMLIPAAGAAQEGSIRYTRAIKYQFELPPERRDLLDMIPAASVTPMVLLFSPSASLMKVVPEEGAAKAAVSDQAPRGQALVARLRMASVARADHETLLDTYVSHDDGVITETREFMGRTFLLSDARPAFAWKLTGEQSEFLGYGVQKATALQDSAAIEAWFTPEIPVPAGPGHFGGLPGMILVVSVNDGHTVYSATEIGLGPVEKGVIRAPENGNRVSREEYEKIVAEKMEELRMERQRRSRDGVIRR